MVSSKGYNNKFMKMAISEAIKSEKDGGIPIGCVLIKQDKVISKEHNRRIQNANPILHAEISCLERALKKGINLNGCVLYTTNMPCYLCSGAIIQFGVSKVVAGESKSFPHAQNILEQNNVEVVNLDLEECKKIMTNFIIKNYHVWADASPKNCPKRSNNKNDAGFR
jgi:cytosine deaminase